MKGQNFFDKADDFFKDNVQSGNIDYPAIVNHPSQLNELISYIEKHPYKQMDETERKAYLINVYNLFVIESVVKHFPINSPMDVPGFFESEKHNLAGKKYDLNAIENDILRSEFQDNRIHFVLVCGAIGCPPIINEAYTPENLDLYLNQQTRLALNNPEFIRVDHNKIEISEIFSWYKSDFLIESKNIRDFINQYRIIQLHENHKIDYYDYDWSLNQLTKETNAIFSKGLPENKISLIQSYTPSSLLGKGHWEFSIFNNLYTQTRAVDQNGKIWKVKRENYFTSSLKAIYGVSKQKRINVGIILNLKSTTLKSNALSPLQFQDNEIDSRSGLGSIAPVLKITPFKNIGNFSVQTSLSIPLETQPETPVFLDKNSYVWSNQFFYDISFAKDRFQFFTELDINLIFGDKELGYANNSISTPASVFLSYFPNYLTTVYTMIQHSPSYGLGNSGFDQNFTQYGLGGKYQIFEKMNIEILITDFFRGENSGIGETYNFGLKYIL